MRTQSLRTLVSNYGPQNAGAAIIEAVNAPNPEDRIDPGDVSIRELWEAFMGPVGVTLQFASRGGQVLTAPSDVLEAPMTSTMFTDITQELLGREVIAGYEMPGLIGDQLVSNYPSRTLNEKLPGFTSSEGPDTVLEGEEYPYSKGIGAKYVGTDVALKKGRIIQITEEAIYFDQTGILLERGKGIGEKAALTREKTILSAVFGVVSPYYPSGTQDAAYFEAAGVGQKGNLLVNPFVDWQALETSRRAFAGRVDSEGDPIIIRATDIVVPDALRERAIRAMGTTLVVQDANPALGTEVLRAHSPNPIVQLLGGSPRILSTTVIDISLGISNDWIHGDCKKQLRWKDIWPLSVTQVSTPDSPNRFSRDIVAEVKVRYYGGVFAVDWRYMNRNNAS